jgi:hypothetical protein
MNSASGSSLCCFPTYWSHMSLLFFQVYPGIWYRPYLFCLNVYCAVISTCLASLLSVATSFLSDCLGCTVYHACARILPATPASAIDIPAFQHHWHVVHAFATCHILPSSPTVLPASSIGMFCLPHRLTCSSCLPQLTGTVLPTSPSDMSCMPPPPPPTDMISKWHVLPVSPAGMFVFLSPPTVCLPAYPTGMFCLPLLLTSSDLLSH